jgi:hypothetical protein
MLFSSPAPSWQGLLPICDSPNALSDLILTSNDSKKFACHKIVLASQSSYFHTLLTGNFSDSNVNCVEVPCSSNALQEFLRWVYVKEYLYVPENLVTRGDIESSLIFELWNTARYLGLEDLARHLENRILDSVLTEANIFTFIRVFYAIDCPSLKLLLRVFFLKRIEELQARPEFLALPSHLVGELVRAALPVGYTFQTECEYHRRSALIRWDQENRRAQKRRLAEEEQKHFVVSVPSLSASALFAAVASLLPISDARKSVTSSSSSDIQQQQQQEPPSKKRRLEPQA